MLTIQQKKKKIILKLPNYAQEMMKIFLILRNMLVLEKKSPPLELNCLHERNFTLDQEGALRRPKAAGQEAHSDFIRIQIMARV